MLSGHSSYYIIFLKNKQTKKKNSLFQEYAHLRTSFWTFRWRQGREDDAIAGTKREQCEGFSAAMSCLGFHAAKGYVQVQQVTFLTRLSVMWIANTLCTAVPWWGSMPPPVWNRSSFNSRAKWPHTNFCHLWQALSTMFLFPFSTMRPFHLL